jgi:hypothetical protein
VRLLPRWGIWAFVLVVGRGGEVVAAAASHRPDDSNPAVRAPACWSRSNFLLPGNDDDVTLSTETQGRVDRFGVALATARGWLPAFRGWFQVSLSCSERCTNPVLFVRLGKTGSFLSHCGKVDDGIR